MVGGEATAAPPGSVARAMWATPATAAAKRGQAAPQGWQMALRSSRLGELRVRLLNRVLVWSLRGRFGAFLRWRVHVFESRPAEIGWVAAGPDDGRLHELLREVEHMKAEVAASSSLSAASSSSRTPNPKMLQQRASASRGR